MAHTDKQVALEMNIGIAECVTFTKDGCLCWFDLRTKDVLLTMEAANKPISSICFKPGNEDCVYISAGNEILSFDVRMGTCYGRHHIWAQGKAANWLNQPGAGLVES
ncbi:uncharacterized protein [Miscanthus floridulus]|uniref:uncharacterized protein isoform X2 n=1 Tax=Miscanthus floridulus TaxID=154761 RepID=UPI003458147E